MVTKKAANAAFQIFISSYSSSFRTLLGLKYSKTPKVIQYGTTNPSKKSSIQKAIPNIKKKVTIPKVLMFIIFASSFA